MIKHLNYMYQYKAKLIIHIAIIIFMFCGCNDYASFTLLSGEKFSDKVLTV